MQTSWPPKQLGFQNSPHQNLGIDLPREYDLHVVWTHLFSFLDVCFSTPLDNPPFKITRPLSSASSDFLPFVRHVGFFLKMIHIFHPQMRFLSSSLDDLLSVFRWLTFCYFRCLLHAHMTYCFHLATVSSFTSSLFSIYKWLSFSIVSRHTFCVCVSFVLFSVSLFVWVSPVHFRLIQSLESLKLVEFNKYLVNQTNTIFRHILYLLKIHNLLVSPFAVIQVGHCDEGMLQSFVAGNSFIPVNAEQLFNEVCKYFDIFVCRFRLIFKQLDVGNNLSSLRDNKHALVWPVYSISPLDKPWLSHLVMRSSSMTHSQP